MRITIEDETTVRERLAQIRETYGSPARLRARVASRPNDLAARLALHDLTEYADNDPEERILETREVILRDHELGALTFRRLELLLALRTQGEAPSIRRLAEDLGRDVKNVSLDVQALHDLGLLRVDEAGPGKPSRVRLPGHRIDLHLVEPDTVQA